MPISDNGEKHLKRAGILLELASQIRLHALLWQILMVVAVPAVPGTKHLYLYLTILNANTTNNNVCLSVCLCTCSFQLISAAAEYILMGLSHMDN